MRYHPDMMIFTNTKKQLQNNTIELIGMDFNEWVFCAIYR